MARPSAAFATPPPITRWRGGGLPEQLITRPAAAVAGIIAGVERGWGPEVIRYTCVTHWGVGRVFGEKIDPIFKLVIYFIIGSIRFGFGGNLFGSLRLFIKGLTVKLLNRYGYPMGLDNDLLGSWLIHLGSLWLSNGVLPVIYLCICGYPMEYYQ